MKYCYLFLFVSLFSCQREDTTFTEQLWLVGQAGQGAFSLGDVLAFEENWVQVRNKFTGEAYTLAWLLSPKENSTDSTYYLVPTYTEDAALTVALYQGDSLLAQPIALQPAMANDTTTLFCLPGGVTYALSFLDTMLHLSTVKQAGNDRLEAVHLKKADFSFQEQWIENRTRLISSTLNANGFLEMGLIYIKPSKSSRELLVYNCGCASGHNASEQDASEERLLLHCLVRPASSDKSGTAGLYASRAESWERLDTLVLEPLPPRIPLTISEAEILAQLNNGHIEVVENLATLGAQQVNYTDQESFVAQGGLLYKELESLGFHFSPTGLFTLFTKDRVLLERQWQLAEDRRHIFLQDDKGRSSYLTILAYNEDWLSLGIGGLRVATPVNLGEQLMSYVQTALVFKVFRE